MDLYLKWKSFFGTKRLAFYDECNKNRFYADIMIDHSVNKFRIYDNSGKKLAFVRKKPFGFHNIYNITVGERKIGEMIEKFSFFRQTYVVSRLGWKVEVDPSNLNYRVMDEGRQIVEVSKLKSKRLIASEVTYKISVFDGIDLATALAVMLTALISIEENLIV